MIMDALSFGMASALAFAGLGSSSVQDGLNADWGYSIAQSQSQSKSDQEKARREMQAGNVLSLRQIERRILPQMKGSEYLGPSYDSAARAYRLKFIKNGRVTYVDVDARTGKIINRSR